MENKGLLFIPDISGFTNFVTTMEIEHSRNIIQELLEVLIDSNQLGLEISEVEGDAILFYKFGDSPDLDSIYKQVEKMFSAFHQHLRAYETRRFCQCQACIKAIDLSLKVITHYGEFTGYTVKNFYKLIGKDVIVAHQLLKNDIDQHEYWLVTKDLSMDKSPADFVGWMKWDKGSKKTENGEIPFHYTQLSQLKKELPETIPPSLELPKKIKVASLTKEFDVNIKKLFYTIAHFELRSQWLDGVKTIDEVDHLLPGVGTKHRCVLDKGQVVLYSSSFSYDPDRQIIFSETEEHKKHATYYIMDKISENKTRLTIDLYLGGNPVMHILFNIFMKKKTITQFEKSLSNLDGLLKEIELPVEF